MFALKKSRVVDRGVRARRGTERVDETRVDEKRAWVPYWYCLSHGSSWLYITTTMHDARGYCIFFVEKP